MSRLQQLSAGKYFYVHALPFQLLPGRHTGNKHGLEGLTGFILENSNIPALL